MFEGSIGLERYISVDSIEAVAAERERVRSQARDTLALRADLIAQGSSQEIPLAIDALSTADKVLAARSEFGEDSKDYQERLAGLDLDCTRLVAEWYRKKKPEYFPPSRHYFDAATGDFYSHGMSIRQMTDNALRPIQDNPEEEARRINERVENETPQILRSIGGVSLAGFGIRTISECTDKAIQDYQEDQKNGRPHAGYDGYVPEIEKVMIRDMRFEDSGDRLEEQIGLPGVYINHFVIQEAIRRRGVETRGMSKTDLHGTQLLVDDDLMDFARLLDEVASEEWCTNIFMGEEVPGDFVKDYDNFRHDALARQESLKDTAKTVRNFILDLANDGFDRRKAPAHVEEFVKRLLLGIAVKDAEVAEQIFDAPTAMGLQEVAYLQSIGRNQEAFERLIEVEQNAPGGGYCSGGSCGLENIKEYSTEGQRLKTALKAEPGETIVKDTERRCKCGAKNIVYAYSSTKVKKYCDSCGASESKRSVVKNG